MKNQSMVPALLRDLWDKKGWIIGFNLLAALGALVVTLLMPKEYLAEASLLPANSRMMDKQRLFGENIQELYSAYGGSDDLDRLFATMESASVLQHVTDSLNLIGYYKLSGKKNARIVARKNLEQQIKLIRSEYGELRLRVWDKDTTMSERIAGALIVRTQQVFDDMFRLYYDRSIGNLQRELDARNQLPADSLAKVVNATDKAFLQNRIAEYQVTRLNPPPAFIVMEQPMASTIADRPRLLMNLLAAIFFATFTSVAFFSARIVWQKL